MSYNVPRIHELAGWRDFCPSIHAKGVTDGQQVRSEALAGAVNAAVMQRVAHDPKLRLNNIKSSRVFNHTANIFQVPTFKIYKKLNLERGKVLPNPSSSRAQNQIEDNNPGAQPQQQFYDQVSCKTSALLLLIPNRYPYFGIPV